MSSRGGRIVALLSALGGTVVGVGACTVPVALPGVTSGDASTGSPPGSTDDGSPPDVNDSDAAPSSDRPSTPAPRDGSEREVSCEPRTRTFDYRIERPQVIIAVNRSISMLMTMFGTERMRDAVRDELVPVLATLEGGIEFGYSEFPAHATCNQASGCCASDVLLGPSPRRSLDIEKQLTCLKGATGCFEAPPDAPIGEALAKIRTFAVTMIDAGSDVFALVITDGAPSCAGDPNPCDSASTAAARLLNSVAGKTIVLGVGDGARPGNVCLDNLARAGGLGRQGSPAYPWAGDPSVLRTRIEEALAPVKALTCRLTPTGDSGTASVNVLVGDQRLPRDTTGKEGWNFDPPGSDDIRFYGSACDALLAGATTRDEIVVQQTCTKCQGMPLTCP
jgi:hypothetical protein